MSNLRTESGLDWKIWFIVFGVFALAVALWINRDMKGRPEAELATDHVDHSIKAHTTKNRQAADTLSSIARKP